MLESGHSLPVGYDDADRAEQVRGQAASLAENVWQSGGRRVRGCVSGRQLGRHPFDRARRSDLVLLHFSTPLSEVFKSVFLLPRYNHYHWNPCARTPLAVNWEAGGSERFRKPCFGRNMDSTTQRGSERFRTLVGFHLRSNPITTDQLRGTLKYLGLLLLLSPLGCSHERCNCQDDLTQRILPPLDFGIHEEATTSRKMAPTSSSESLAPSAQARPVNPTDSKEARLSPPSQGIGGLCEPAQLFTLTEAIDTAFRQQPRLRVHLENLEQARRNQEIAFVPFLPTAVAGYSVGGFDLTAGGKSQPLGPLPRFTFLPALGSIPIGLNINTGYELADLKLQWLLCDFGRRLGRYRQAGLAVDIAQLQTDRAYKTVASEVSVAYYQVLRTRALTKTARDAVRRGQDDLDVAKKLEKGGALEKEKRLRVEVQLAESQRLLDAAEGAEAVAVAALNLAIGLNVNAPTGVVETSDVPPFTQSLSERLPIARSGPPHRGK